MFLNIDAPTLIGAGLAITAIAYFMAAATDTIMGRDGFGTIRNMIILIAGAGIGLFVAERLRLPAHGLPMQALASICGGFACLALLAVLKALANRFGY